LTSVTLSGGVDAPMCPRSTPRCQWSSSSCRRLTPSCRLWT
jgi:hypothetical protein